MRILLQFPEGLKAEAVREAEKLEAQGHEVFISSSPCYGACDVAVDEARKLKAGRIIHFGHAQFLQSSEIPVEYVEWDLKADWKPVIEKALGLAELKNARSIVLATTVQHVKQIPEIKKFLESKGKAVLLGRGRLAKHPGQVLGCDAGAVASVLEKSDAVLYFGGGLFHPLGIRSDKPVIACNPFSGEVKLLNEEIKRLERKRKAAISAASEAKSFGILVSTKPGQFALEAAREIKKKLEAKGRKAEILVSNELNWVSLENFRAFDCYVNTACPRIREDTELARKPVLNAEDALELIRLLG